MIYTICFSIYLSDSNKYAANFAAFTYNEGFTYVFGNTRDKNLSVAEKIIQELPTYIMLGRIILNDATIKE